MMKLNFKPLILLFFLFLNTSIFAQRTGEIWNCQTTSQNNKSFKLEKIPVTINPKFINIFIHIVRRSNGSEGLTNTQINNSLSILRSNYQDRNIFFLEIGRTFINDNSFYNGISSESEYNSLINTDRHSDAIDIYFLSPTDSYARASGIPGDALAFGGSYAETSVLSHEIGHCLGLYHTHSGNGCYDNANCAENIDGSNCFTCGDLVCDTPADPCLSGKVDSDCNYTGGGGYLPDTDNIMSYAPPTCLDDLTNGQMNRLHNIITNSSILQSLSYLTGISGSSTVCNSNSTFKLYNLPPNATIEWDKSSNLTQIGENTGASYIVKANGSGNGWVEVNVNGAKFKKTFKVGTPSKPIIWLPFKKVGMNSYIESTAISKGADNYLWSVGGGTILWGQGTNNIALRTSSRCLYDLTVRLTTSNACGNSAPAMVSKPFDCSGLPSPLKISPNPATSEATIEISSENEKFDKSTEWELEVYNPYFILQEKQNKLKGNKFKLNTSSWKEGVYIIRATFKGEILNGKLIIKK